MICQEGDTLQLTIINRLSATHNFVIGGLKSSDPTLVSSGDIAGGGSRTITYTIPSGKAGSYLFYDNKTSYNIFLGLHGGLAIMPAGSSNQLYSGSPSFVNQQFWVFNDIDPALNNAVRNGTTILNSFTPRYFTINGLSSRPPGAPDHGDPAIDALYDTRSRLVGHVGDRVPTVEVSDTVHLTTSQDILAALAAGTGPARALMALGYAGWGAGQLEMEMSANAWLSVPGSATIVFDTPFEQRWSAAAGLLGINLATLSSEAGHA